MKVAVVHDGRAQEGDGSVRTLRVLDWLKASYATRFVDVSVRPDADRASDDSVVRIPIGWRRSRFAASLIPGVGGAFEAHDIAALDEATADADWIWVGWWPLMHATGLVSRWRHRGTFVTWDEDALSRSWFLAARAYARSDPFKTVRRAMAASSFLWFERHALSAASVVIARSPADYGYLRRWQQSPVRLVRNCVDLRAFAAARENPVSATPMRVTFLGSRYEPNVHGMRWFIRSVWPRVTAHIPHARLALVGDVASEVATSDPSVELIGRVGDVRPWLADTRVVVCPLFFGGGLPNKLLEAWAARRPVIISEYCDTAIGGDAPLRPARSSEEWAGLVVRSLSEPEWADAEGRAGYEFVSRYGVDQMHVEMAALANEGLATL